MLPQCRDEEDIFLYCTNRVFRSLGTEKNIYPTILPVDSTKHDTAVIIVSFTENAIEIHGIKFLRCLPENRL